MDPTWNNSQIEVGRSAWWRHERNYGWVSGANQKPAGSLTARLWTFFHPQRSQNVFQSEMAFKGGFHSFFTSKGRKPLKKHMELQKKTWALLKSWLIPRIWSSKCVTSESNFCWSWDLHLYIYIYLTLFDYIYIYIIYVYNCVYLFYYIYISYFKYFQSKPRHLQLPAFSHRKPPAEEAGSWPQIHHEALCSISLHLSLQIILLIYL